jgi:hypothetical protein
LPISSVNATEDSHYARKVETYQLEKDIILAPAKCDIMTKEETEERIIAT